MGEMNKTDAERIIKLEAYRDGDVRRIDRMERKQDWLLWLGWALLAVNVWGLIKK
jgi:hypothetical protein